MELQSIDEEVLSSILIHKNSIIHLSEEELRQYKLQLAMCKKAYNNFVNSKELYRLFYRAGEGHKESIHYKCNVF